MPTDYGLWDADRKDIEMAQVPLVFFERVFYMRVRDVPSIRSSGGTGAIASVRHI